jgi:putative salt-induced outer membrane protein
MNKPTQIFLFVATISTACIYSASTLADDAAANKPPASDLEFGFLTTSGNTSSETTKANCNIKRDFAQWRSQMVLSALVKKDEVEYIDIDGEKYQEKQVSAEQYFSSLQADYKLDKKYKALFVFGSYDDTRFSGYDYQATLSVGYSNRLFETQNAYLNYNIGPGMAFHRTDEIFAKNGAMLKDNIKDESAIVRLAAEYQYLFSETAKFTQTFASDVAVKSDANTRTKLESAILANLNQALALKASVTIAHNSEAPDDLENVDSQTALTLVYTF